MRQTSINGMFVLFYCRDRRGGYWSTEGCVVVSEESSDHVTVCKCNHLTNFAVLMSPFKEVQCNV